MRVRLAADGGITLGERFVTFADPGRPLAPPIARLTGIRDQDLAGAPTCEEAVAAFTRFAVGDDAPWLLGHNVGFDVGFLERAGMPVGAEQLDTAALASIVPASVRGKFVSGIKMTSPRRKGCPLRLLY